MLTNNCPLPSKPFPLYIYFLPNICHLHQFDNLSHVSQMVGYTGEKLQELHSNPNPSEKLHDGKGCLKSFFLEGKLKQLLDLGWKSILL